MTGLTALPAVDAGDPLPSEPLSELGYARRLIHVYGDRLRYVYEWRKWLSWDGCRWADGRGQPERWAKATARRIYADAIAVADDTKRRAAVHAARKGESSASISGVLKLASTEAEIVVSPGDLDSHPMLLNCANGTVDLRTLRLRPHDPADMLTKMTNASFHQDATGVAWRGFLNRVQPDPEMRAYLARLLGHSLEGRVSEHILPIHHGVGANGKSTFIDAILRALGEYADAADPDLLTARSFDAHPTGVADLHGLRLAVLHESDAGRRLAEGTVKRLTAGDKVKARRMREDFWSFQPSHTFNMLTNHAPIITGCDEGIWRRIRLVPWDVVIPADERDAELSDRLRAEADGVLGWLLGGYREWHERGLAEPEAVTTATAAYRADSDALGRFLAAACRVGPHYSVRSSHLHEAWTRWCGAEGEEPGTNKALTTALQARGFDTKRRSDGNWWSGIGLADRHDA